MNNIKFILSMVIFGTIGIFVRYIPLPSSTIALFRALIGVVFLALVILVSGKHISFSAIKKNIILLCISGVMLGINWIFLFEAYKYTSVATATLCYYLAPAFVIAASPFVLKEKLSIVKIICVGVSFVGMIFVSGVLSSGFSVAEITGVGFGVAAAVLYATIVLINKKMVDLPSFDKTLCQLFISAVTLLPYVLFTENLSDVLILPSNSLIMLILVGVVHTGIAYALYFGAISKLKAQSVALFSYIDPVCAIILSITVLSESFDIYSIIGAVMILGASLFGELKKA